MSDELRERLVARIKETRPDACVASSLEGWSHDAFDRYIADTAIALIWNEAREEAAKVVHDNWQSGSCTYICAAIRARKKP